MAFQPTLLPKGLPGPNTRRKHPVGVMKSMQCQADLLLAVLATHPVRRFADLLHRRQ